MDTFKKVFIDQHFAMERFTALTIALIVCLALVTSSAFGAYLVQQQVNLSNSAVYTTSFSTSKTNLKGEVVGVYSNSAKTKAFLLLKFNDVSKISTDAANYQMFLTGSSPDMTKQRVNGLPSAAICMFGNTGYMGIYMVNQAGFPTQILDLVIRCNSELVEQSNVQSKEGATDASFNKYDQFRVYFNPGASEAQLLDCLESDELPSMTELYSQTVAKTSEAEIRTKLDDQLKTMQTDLKVIEEYTHRLSDVDNVFVPIAPAAISGDTVTADENGNLVLNSTYTLAGGYDFDWRDGSVAEGASHIDEEILGYSGISSYDQFFIKKNEEAKAATNESPSGYSSNIEWTLKDGTLVSDLNTTSTNAGSTNTYQQIQKDISALTNAWTTYYNDKRTYQVNLLGELLSLEASIDTVTKSSSTNTSSEALTIY